jgi:hypothetical protein
MEREEMAAQQFLERIFKLDNDASYVRLNIGAALAPTSLPSFCPLDIPGTRSLPLSEFCDWIGSGKSGKVFYG